MDDNKTNTTPDVETPEVAPVEKEAKGKKKKTSSGNDNKVQEKVVYKTDPELLAKLERQEKQLATLFQVADQHRLQRLGEVDLGPKRLRIRLFQSEDGQSKVIVGWKMLRNHVTPKTAYDDANQIIQITLHDGTTEEMTYYNFAVTYDDKVEVGVDSITETHTPKGPKKVYVFTYNGEQHQIGEDFVN